MKHLFLLLICLGLTKLAATQARFAGIVNSNEEKPISNASVLLLNTKDSSLVKGVTTNNSGAFLLEKIAPGNYLAVISYAGFHDKYLPADLLNQKTFDIGVIMLSPVSKELKEVVVTGKKPLYEQKIDRMVINVKSSITSAGGTVLEVLEKSPGVTVDRSTGSVSLNGKDGVMVMINGKMSYMPQEALLQMLNGVNASNVERIELITTPPAKYDAGGNAGYINIVLLANPDQGFNGSYSLSGGVGSGSVVNASANFNYRKKNINLYGSYAFSRDAQLQVFESHRSVVFEGNLNAIDIVSNRDPAQRNHNARLGMDYKAGKKTVIGVLLGGYDNKWSMDAVNNSQSSINGQPDTSIVINNQEVNHWKNAMGNVNLQHNFKAGEELTFNTDFLYYKNNNPTDYQNAYYDKNGSYLHTDNTSSTKETIIKVFVSQADYSKKINDKASMEMGIKGSFSKFTNDVLVQEEKGGSWIPNPKYTANYYLNEEIFAAYISGDARMGNNTSVKAGLRYEYTSSNLGSETEKDIVDRKYGKLFPTLFISQKLNDNNTVNFSYNRRINRPSFTQLAPFLIFFDPKTFITGNPALQPGIMDAVKVDYIIKKMVFSASYSYEDNAITRFLSEVDSTNNSQITMSQNLDKSQLVYVSASLPTRITSWWNSQLNLAVNWNKVNAVINKEAAEFSQVYYRITGAETFKLPKEFSIELSGFYQSKSLFGAFEVQPFGGLNAAIQKKFKNSGALTFGVDNILNSYKFKVSQSVASQHIESKGVFIFSQRLFKLTWSQNFGSKVLKEKRNRTTASEEERRRVE